MSKDNDLIGPMDVALVETKISIERGSAIQPICLPPPEINNVEALENFVKFEDLDCKVDLCGAMKICRITIR